MQAHALPMYKNKLLLVLRDNIENIPYPNCWGLIGGNSIGDEVPEETLLRKFKDETGVTPKNYQYMMKWPGKETHVFFVSLQDKEVEQIKVGNEGQELKFFSIEEIETLPLAGTFGKEFHNYRSLLHDLSQTT